MAILALLMRQWYHQWSYRESGLPQPLPVQLRPAVPPEEPPRRGGPAGAEIDVRDHQVLLQALAAGEDPPLGIGHEGLPREMEASLGADPVGQGGEVAVLEGG